MLTGKRVKNVHNLPSTILTLAFSKNHNKNKTTDDWSLKNIKNNDTSAVHC